MIPPPPPSFPYITAVVGPGINLIPYHYKMLLLLSNPPIFGKSNNALNLLLVFIYSKIKFISNYKNCFTGGRISQKMRP